MVTLAVLRNNRTMETIISTTEEDTNETEERPCKRARLLLGRHPPPHRQVRFSTEQPQTVTYSNFDQAMTAEQVQEICERIWYTVRDETKKGKETQRNGIVHGWMDCRVFSHLVFVWT